MSLLSKVWIIDFGSQYTQLIARRIREMAVFSEIVLPNVTAEDVKKNNVSAVILSGGPSSVYEDNAPVSDENIFELDIPILGICYGLQLISRYFGSRVHSENHREYGSSQVFLEKNHILFDGINLPIKAWMSHGDHVDSIPENFEVLAISENKAPAALAHNSRNIMGLQFHPEVQHTDRGKDILENFLFKIAKLEKNWTSHHFINEAINRIKQTVGRDKVLMALSGGVDSSVMAVLINKAIGDQCVPVFIDNGLLRKNEHNKVIDLLKNKMGLPVEKHDYSDDFLSALKGVTDPEQKRKIIGHEFIKAFEKISKMHPDFKYLAQGTLYPDVIESRSVSGPSHVIKSHHNVGGLPEKMKLKLIEPFDSLFKDEVRKIGKELEINDHVLKRHPFPGPGLGVRILGEITQERIRVLQDADDIFISELYSSGAYNDVWQAFVVLLPVKTVGVMGDQRTYEDVCAIRSVNSSDGMTADWSRLDFELLSRVSNRIVNEVRGINRVVYDITSKPPGTIEWE